MSTSRSDKGQIACFSRFAAVLTLLWPWICDFLVCVFNYQGFPWKASDRSRSPPHTPDSPEASDLPFAQKYGYSTWWLIVWMNGSVIFVFCCVLWGFMCAYVCRVINKTTFGSFSVLYIQIPYLSLLIQNSGRVVARLGASRGAIHSSPVFYSWKALA